MKKKLSRHQLSLLREKPKCVIQELNNTKAKHIFTPYLCHSARFSSEGCISSLSIREISSNDSSFRCSLFPLKTVEIALLQI